jgi:hypothetical protein
VLVDHLSGARPGARAWRRAAAFALVLVEDLSVARVMRASARNASARHCALALCQWRA